MRLSEMVIRSFGQSSRKGILQFKFSTQPPLPLNMISSAPCAYEQSNDDEINNENSDGERERE